MPQISSNSPDVTVRSLAFTDFGNKAARARTRAGATRAFNDGFASVRFSAVLSVPGAADVTVAGVWTAVQHDYGVVFYNASDATRALAKSHPGWLPLLDAVSLYDRIRDAFLTRLSK